MSTAPDFVDTTDLSDYKAGDAAEIILQVQAAIRSYCGWHIAPSIEQTVTLDGRGSRHLWLPSLYVTDVTSVSNEGTAVTSDEYDWSESGYIESRYGCWTTRPRQVEITFTHGYDDIPADVVGVAVAVAARASASPAGVKREQAGAVSLEYGQFNGVAGGIALLQHERDILERYKLPPRA